jgi:hypothetical protein
MSEHRQSIIQGMEKKVDIRIRLSALWAVLMFLYIYADFLSLYRPSEIDEIRGGMMGPVEVSEVSLMLVAFLVTIPALMVFFTLVLPQKLIRWSNLILGALFTLVNFINLVGEDWAYYIFFGITEVVITLLIIKLAWSHPHLKTKQKTR